MVVANSVTTALKNSAASLSMSCRPRRRASANVESASTSNRTIPELEESKQGEISITRITPVDFSAPPYDVMLQILARQASQNNVSSEVSVSRPRNLLDPYTLPYTDSDVRSL
jgi:hypothetical protein